MSDTEAEKRQRFWSKFYVQIVESPHADDLFDGRTEGRMLSEALSLAEVKSRYRLAVNLDTFSRALSHDLGDAVKNFGLPLLHISAHGNEDGIELTQGAFLPWERVRELVLPINRAMNGRLGLCMSSCHGANACQAAMGEDGAEPFWFVVGPTEAVPWADLAIGYAAFYNRLFQGAHPKAACDALNAVSAESGFVMFGVQFIRDQWDQHQVKQREQ